MPSPPTGRLRPLVPFFASAPDGTLIVNDRLTPPPAPAALSPLVDLPVRVWDAAAGVFRDSSHQVRDVPPPKPARLHSPARRAPKPPPRLLTPADIRAARAAAAAPSPLAAPIPIPVAPLPVPVATMPVATTPVSVIPSAHAAPLRTPTKSRPFAGSTFEAASPPPARLPIPAFARQARQAAPADPRKKDAREQAAVDLRRMLRI